MMPAIKCVEVTGVGNPAQCAMIKALDYLGFSQQATKLKEMGELKLDGLCGFMKQNVPSIGCHQFMKPRAGTVITDLVMVKLPFPTLVIVDGGSAFVVVDDLVFDEESKHPLWLTQSNLAMMIPPGKTVHKILRYNRGYRTKTLQREVLNHW